MAHFTKLDENNVVTKVFKIGNDVAGTEANGIAECIKLHGAGTYKQCSYNTLGGVHYDLQNDPVTVSSDQSKAFRKNFPGRGFTYNSDIDGFVSSKPYPSWVLNNTTGTWEAPVAIPAQPGGDLLVEYIWDEESQSWTS
tara:strand:- start:536 stop:952 length:417 start_codon:yes stop_codon:yes gene_type:complete